MFVCSLKASRIKAFALTMLCAVVLGGALTLILGKAGRSEDLAAAAFSERNIKFDEIKNSQDLENFIASLGMEVKTPPLKSVKVDLPRVFDAVYAKYNDIQKQQGFDLTKYCGKTVDRYTYELTNHPLSSQEADKKVYLTLLVCREKIVGGDISSKSNGGFVTTFTDFTPQNNGQ